MTYLSRLFGRNKIELRKMRCRFTYTPKPRMGILWVLFGRGRVELIVKSEEEDMLRVSLIAERGNWRIVRTFNLT